MPSSTSPSMVKAALLRISPFTTTPFPRMVSSSGVSCPNDGVADIAARSLYLNDCRVVRLSAVKGRVALPIQRNQRTLIRSDGSGILSQVADVVDATGQYIEIAVLDGFEHGDAQFGMVRDLFERYASTPAKRCQTRTVPRQHFHSYS